MVAAGTWTAKVLDYMQRKTTAAAFLASATNDGERTEAHTYIGFDDALGGRRDAAIAHFRWVKDKGSRNFVEYPIAAAELKRLEASRVEVAPVRLHGNFVPGKETVQFRALAVRPHRPTNWPPGQDLGRFARTAKGTHFGLKPVSVSG